MIPEAGFLDSFGLRTLSITLRKSKDGPLALYAISPYISTKKPVQLPIENLTLKSVDLRFIIQWGYGEQQWKLGRQLTAADASSYLITGDVGANVELVMPKGKLTFFVNATFPDLEFEGSLKFASGSNEGLERIMGDSVAGTLPLESSNLQIALAEIYATAGYTSRTLSFDAMVRGEMCILKLPKADINLKEINAGARFTQKGNSFYIGGTLGFKPKNYDEFALSLSAAYDKETWLFEGGLSSGEVSLAAVLDGILGYENVDKFKEIKLTAFWVSYKYKKGAISPFSLRAAVSVDVSEIFEYNIKGAAALALETDEHGKMMASLLAEMEVGKFAASVQMDGIGTNNSSYISIFLFREKGLRAALYIKKEEGKQDKKYLTMNLVNVTLGDIVDFLVKTVDKNYTSTLPAPLDALYKIDLSKLVLTYTIEGDAKGTLELKYTLNLDLIVAKITSVGVTYTPAKGTKSADVKMVLEGKSLLENSSLCENDVFGKPWSLINDPPPDLGGKGTSKFSLEYMGLLVHYDSENKEESIIDPKLDKIDKVLERMKKPLNAYNSGVNFAFGTHFIINGIFDVKVAFVDPRIYGLRITVSDKDTDKTNPLSSLSGLELELLYKRISDKLGMFRASLILPEKNRTLNLGAVSITAGLMTLEIYTDGGFLIDLGFPHNRDFSRSFVIIVGQYKGRVGLYFGILSGAAVPELPDWNGKAGKGVGSFAPVIKVGLGLTLGIGKEFNFGIVKGGLELSAVGIFEGTLALWVKKGESKPSAMYYKLSATLGIIGRLYVAVDLKLIVLAANVDISAYAMAVFETDKPIIIDLDLSLSLSGSVKIAFVKIHFKYSFNYHAHFEIGSNVQIPVKLAHINICNLQLEEKTIIEWFLVPSPTLLENHTALVPVISNFSGLYKMAVQVCLCNQDEIIHKETANNLNYAVPFEFDELNDFLTNNAEFKILHLLAEPEDGTESKGYVIPMPPHVTVTIDNCCPIDYTEHNSITEEYIAKIRAYFDDNKSELVDNELSEDKEISCAKYIFTDYFNTLIRQINGEIESMYNEYTVPLDDFSTLAEKYGVPAADIASINQKLCLKAGQKIAVENLTYICPKATSFSALKDQFETQNLWADISELPILANTKIKIKDFSFKLPLEEELDEERKKKVNAAFMFSHWFGDEPDLIPTHWQKLYEEISKESKKDIDWECTTFDQKDTFTYKDITWTFQLGDTVERLAKMFALINAEEGYFPEFDEFLAGIETKSDGKNTTYMFPDSEVPVFSFETLAQCERRMFVSDGKDEIKSKDFNIIARFSSIPLNGEVFTVSQDQSLCDFIQENNLNFETIAPHLKASHFVENEKVTLKPNTIPTFEIEQHLISDRDAMSRTAAFASRILTQGARLPAKEGEETIGFYELCGLQFPLEAGRHIVHLEAKENTWVTGYRGYHIDIPKEANVRDTLPNDTVIEEINPFKDVPVTYQVSEKFLVSKRFTERNKEEKDNIIERDEVIRYLPFATENKPFSLHYSDRTDEKIECIPALCLPFTVVCESEHVLRVIGLSPQDRQKLFPLIKQPNYSYSILHKPGSLSGLTGILIDTGFGKDEKFFKTNLSRETKRTLAANETDKYMCSLDEPAFIKMLWECSVTCGNYALYVSDANKLPSDMFDDNTAQLYILVKEREEPSQEFTQLANCVSSVDTANINKNAFFVRENDSTAQPTLPNGHYGIQITCNPEDSVSQILGYTVTVNGNESKLSKPLIPLADKDSKNEEIAVYKPIFQIGEPYDDFKTAEVSVYQRDIFGNQASDPKKHTVHYRVNDFIVAINEWYGITCSYTFTNKGEKAKLEITLETAKIDENPFNFSKQAKADLERALEQQKREETSLYVFSSLFEAEYPVDKELIVQFLKDLLEYYQELSNIAPSLTIPVPLNAEKLPTDPIFPANVTLRIRRDVKTDQNTPQDIVLVDTVIGYDKGDFPINGYALAHKNLSDKDVFVVNLDQCIGKPLFEEPEYYALRPLANTSINGADINLWARIFLDDFENKILTDIEALAQCNQATVADLLETKETLANNISKTVINVNKEKETPDPVLAAVTDMLRNKIDCEISSIAAYKVTNQEKAPKARLTLELSRTDQARVISQPGELSDDQYFVILYNAFSRYETDFKVTYSAASVQHFEYNISATSEGYESSEWYSFLTQQNIENFRERKENIPNPLREIPLELQLANSRFEIQSTKDLSACVYKLDITSIAAKQDSIKVRIQFNHPGTYPLRNENSIYTALKAYMDVRDSFITEKITAENVERFTGHAKTICENWSPMTALQANAVDNEISTILSWEGDDLVSSNSKVTVSYDKNKVVFGKPFTITIEIKNLSVYEHISATPYVKITRNADLAKEFTFQTEEKSAPETTSQNVFDEVALGRVGDWDPDSIKEKCKTAYEKLQIPDEQSNQLFIESELTYAYTHRNANAHIRLPVAMFKNASISEIQKTAANWFSTANPSTNSAQFDFSIRVYRNERTVLSIRKMSVQ